MHLYRTGFFLLLYVFLLVQPGPAATYNVGEGLDFENIGDVPWESITAGDTVLIHYKSTAYHEKWVIARSGTESDKIVISGVPGSGGELPVIDGENAVTRQKLSYWSEERGIINIGGSSTPSETPNHIIIENLDIKNARPPYSFTDDSGNKKNYAKNAASFYVIKGSHITIRNCILHNCSNGFFASHESSNIIVEGCYIYDNGMEDSYYEHNNYTEADGIIFQYNRFGPLRAGCGGNNLKDRSSGTIIRYNWIEGGNRQLDLVEAGHSHIYDDPSYDKTFVYGNILFESSDDGNSQVCHYGGDGSDVDQYRKGTLYFYNNTIVSKRSGNTTLFRLSTNDETCDAGNNIVYVTAVGSRLALLGSNGILNIRNNWFKSGWQKSHEGGGFNGTINNLGTTLTSFSPDFVDRQAEDFHLAETSICIDAGASLPDEMLPEHNVIRQYVKHGRDEERPDNEIFDMGAFEYPWSAGLHFNNSQRPDKCALKQNYPNPFNPSTTFTYIVAKHSHVQIRIYNQLGQVVRTLVDEQKPAGHYSLTWNGTDEQGNRLSGGVYVYQLTIDSQRFAKKMILLP